MGILKYKKGNILNPANPEQVIAHQVNCLGGFGSGLAGQIAKQYPEVRAAYIRKHQTTGWQLGQIQIVGLPSGKMFANIAGQHSFGGVKLQTDYVALESGLKQVIWFCEGGNHSLAVPRIGCGLGNGDWVIVEAMLIRCLMERNVNVTVYTV